MDSREFEMWRLYDAHIDPLGDQPIRKLLATFCALYFNAHKGDDVGGVSSDDFMPWVEKPKPEALSEDDAACGLRRAGMMQ